MKLLIIGSSLTGKTTVIKKLKEMGIARISEMDKELTLLNNGRFPETDEKQHKILAPKAIKSVINKRGNYIFFTNTDYFTSDDIRQAKRKGHIVISLRLSKDQLIARNVKRVTEEQYPDLSIHIDEMVLYQEEIKKYDLVDIELDASKPTEYTSKLIYSMLYPPVARKPQLYFFIGLPFSGKTTYSKRISSELTIPRIAFDDRWAGIANEFGDVPGKTGVAKWKFVKKSFKKPLQKESYVSIRTDADLDLLLKQEKLNSL
ncbi:hypothetical protein IT418_01460 [bacterium]|nr:hypothetical protein [bacterium]